MRTPKLLIVLVSLFLVHCATVSTPQSENSSDTKRLPSSQETVFDRYLQTLGLQVYYANLHSHHFMGMNSKDNFTLAPGPCSTNGQFPEDDGRPCRADASGEAQVVLPPSYLDGKFDAIDYFQMVCDYAQAKGGLDILLVTPHTKNGGADGETDTTLEGLQKRHQLLAKINEKYKGAFYCGLGQEASSISSGNHVGVMGHMRVGNSDKTAPFFFPSGHFDKFYPAVKERRSQGEQILLQMNHPDVTGDLYPYMGSGKKSKKNGKGKMNDYGIDDFGALALDDQGHATNASLKEHFATMIAAGADAYRSIEVTQTDGATTNATESFRAVHDHQPDSHPGVGSGTLAYIFYLNMGFKVAASSDQDNHFMNHGSAIASRTGMLLPALTEDNIYNAVDQRHIFATEDRNAKILMTAHVGKNSFLMGQEVSTSEDSIKIAIGYSDADEPGPVDVRIYEYNESDELNFDVAKDPWGPVRTVRFTDNGLQLPNGNTEPQDLKAGLKNGEVKRFVVPLNPKKGRTILFAELTQADGDKIWSAPFFINATQAPSPQ
jgi:hypothetical protein